MENRVTEEPGTVTARDENGDTLIDRLIGYYEDSDQSTQEARWLSERDRDYYDHKQLTAAERATLRKRRQPAIQINRIKPKVDFLLGMERQMRTDVKAFPRTPIHEDGAEAATDSLRYVMDNNEFDYTRSDVFENMIIEGTGGVEVLMKQGKNGLEIDIQHYPWDRIFYDHHARRRDFKDAKYMGGIVWMDKEDALRLADSEEAREAIENAEEESTDSDTYDDTPRIRWVDKERNRIRLASIWHQLGGEWHWAMFTAGGFIQQDRVSPFIDDEDKSECGMILQSAFVDRDGNRYGAVRTWIDPQDEINKRRSKALHLLTMRQTIGEQGAVDDIQKAKRELAKPDGHVMVNPGLRFELLDTNDLAMGQFNLLQEAKAEIDTMGASASLQGKESEVRSGRAEQARQQGSSMELGPAFDSLRYWQKRVYRACWNRIKQYWTEERWIRVTDDEENLKWVGLNKPISIGEQMEQEIGPIPPEFASDPRLQMQVDTENNIAELDVDIILEDAPDTVTIQGEQFEMLTQMYQANPQSQANPDGVPWKMVVEASSLRNKDKALGKDDEDGPSEEEQQAQQQAAQAQMEVIDIQKRDAEADIAVKQSTAMKNKADAKATMDGINKPAIPEQPVPDDTEAEMALERYKVDKDSSTKVQVATINAQADCLKAHCDMSAKKDETEGKHGAGAMRDIIKQSQQDRQRTDAQLEALASMVVDASKPKDKTVTMDVNGKTYTAEVHDNVATMRVDGKEYSGEVRDDYLID